jgi:hypothetical protein
LIFDTLFLNSMIMASGVSTETMHCLQAEVSLWLVPARVVVVVPEVQGLDS